MLVLKLCVVRDGTGTNSGLENILTFFFAVAFFLSGVFSSPSFLRSVCSVTFGEWDRAFGLHLT